MPGTYTVNLFAFNDLGCNASAQATVVVLPQENTTGINEAGKKDIAVITEGKVINVNMNGASLADNAWIEVYNLLGQAVNTQALTTQIATINLNNEANGYYLISIRNAGATNTKRVFITK